MITNRIHSYATPLHAVRGTSLFELPDRVGIHTDQDRAEGKVITVDLANIKFCPTCVDRSFSHVELAQLHGSLMNNCCASNNVQSHAGLNRHRLRLLEEDRLNMFLQAQRVCCRERKSDRYGERGVRKC